MPATRLYEFVERARDVTLNDLKSGHGFDTLFRNTTEELGEVAAAVSIEDGEKFKPLPEPSKVECVDLVICALSLFFARGGQVDELRKIADTKLPKWEQRIQKRIEKMSEIL
jgi:NTP pyrophosphatase (non-canonical NTP hydrolase)